MLDLDAIQARADAAMNPSSETALGQYKPAIASAADVPALVAELRAARELRRHIGYYLAMFNGTDELRRAVDAYDQLTEEPTP